MVCILIDLSQSNIHYVETIIIIMIIMQPSSSNFKNACVCVKKIDVCLTIACYKLNN